MRGAPPLVVHVQRQRALQALVAAIAAAAMAGLIQALNAHGHLSWPAWALLPLAAAWAWREALPLPRRLRWDGQAWWLLEPGHRDEFCVQVAVLIDLDDWLLLGTRPARRWLPLARRQMPSHWGALRATLFASAGAARHR